MITRQESQIKSVLTPRLGSDPGLQAFSGGCRLVSSQVPGTSLIKGSRVVLMDTGSGLGCLELLGPGGLPATASQYETADPATRLEDSLE